MIAIEAEGLRKSFGPARAGAAPPSAAPASASRAGKRRAEPVQALRWVDLSVPRGGVCALLGPNGAGKTTGCWPRCSALTGARPG
jgi:ABC-type multidrug transport system ATPase subunit